MNLETIELSTADNPVASIIWLHGLGADGHDFEGLVTEFKFPENLAIRFIFPHAPYRPVTLNNGYVMRGWYDISSLEFGQQEDTNGIQESSKAICQLIEQEISRGIQSHRIFLAGFSQGGAIALYTALRYQKPLAGVLALSSYLPLKDSLEKAASTANQNLPVFMAHGLQDDIVHYQYGLETRLLLEKLNYSIAWHDYSMSHSVCMEEINDIASWLIEKLSN